MLPEREKILRRHLIQSDAGVFFHAGKESLRLIGAGIHDDETTVLEIYREMFKVSNKVRNFTCESE